MSGPPPPMPAVIWFALPFGGAVVVVATVLALRGRSPAASLWWVALAGVGQVILALAAAARDPVGDGGRAAALQLLTVAMAMVLSGLCSPPADPEEPGPSPLSLVGRCLVWASLVGLPATVGFHSKVVLVRCLLDLDWAGLAVLVLLASWAAMWPALGALRAPFPGRLRGVRAGAASLLIAFMLVLGLYPHWAISAADWLARVVFS